VASTGKRSTGGGPTDTFFTVTELARDLAVTPRTIRVYTKRDRARMVLILRGKRLGFSLREIKEYLDLYDMDPSQGEQLRMLLKKVQTRLEMLEDQRLALEETIVELKEIEDQALATLAIADGETKAAG